MRRLWQRRQISLYLSRLLPQCRHPFFPLFVRVERRRRNSSSKRAARHGSSIAISMGSCEFRPHSAKSLAPGVFSSGLALSTPRSTRLLRMRCTNSRSASRTPNRAGVRQKYLRRLTAHSSTAAFASGPENVKGRSCTLWASMDAAKGWLGPPDDHRQSGGDIAHADGSIGTGIALLLRHSLPKALHRHLIVLGTEWMAGTAELLHAGERSTQRPRNLFGRRLGTKEESRHTVRVPGHVPRVHWGARDTSWTTTCSTLTDLGQGLERICPSTFAGGSGLCH